MGTTERLNGPSAGLSRIAEWIVQKAVARLPASARERYREEWIADLRESRSIISKLYSALGMFFAARDISRILTLADGISGAISSQLRQGNLYKGPDRVEPKIELKVTWEKGGLYPLLFGGRPDFKVDIERSRLPEVNEKELVKHLLEIEAKYPLHFAGRLPRGAAAHVFDDDAIDLLAEKREGLSLLDLAGAEIELAERLGRPVGIVLKSGLKGADRENILALVQPL